MSSSPPAEKPEKTMLPSSPSGKPGKTMSSRLLTMKFMQRAAATAAAKDAQAPSEDTAPKTKRQRLSTESGVPATPQAELDAISAALAAEEEKRREAISRQAAEAGETHWVLDIPTASPSPAQPLVVAADSLDAEDNILQGGRRAYGNFTRKTKQPPPVQEQPKNKDADGDEDEEKPKPAKPKPAKPKPAKPKPAKPKPVKPVDPAKEEQRKKNKQKKIALAKKDQENRGNPDYVKQRGLISSGHDRPEWKKHKSQ